MSSDDVVASISKGTIEGILDWTEQKVLLFAQKILSRDVAFVQDLEIIQIAKEQRKTSEWDIFQKYVKDSRLRIIFQMGLTLRRVENNKEQCDNLRDKIMKKYDSEGLHIAQFVQNGFFSKYIGNILERAKTPEALTFEIENLFGNIERTTSFIQLSDNVDKEADEIVVRIQSLTPKTYIICGSRTAMKLCQKVEEKVMKKISGYTVELYKTDIKEIYFLNKVSSN